MRYAKIFILLYSAVTNPHTHPSYLLPTTCFRSFCFVSCRLKFGLIKPDTKLKSQKFSIQSSVKSCNSALQWVWYIFRPAGKLLFTTALSLWTALFIIYPKLFFFMGHSIRLRWWIQLISENSGEQYTVTQYTFCSFYQQQGNLNLRKQRSRFQQITRVAVFDQNGQKINLKKSDVALFYKTQLYCCIEM